MSCNKCYEWCKTFLKDTATNEGGTTKGTNVNKVIQVLADILCNVKTNTGHLKDALNLKLEKDFVDTDKKRIFENIISQKEEEFNLHKSDIFTIPSDLQARIELLRLFDAFVRGKLQSIDDIKKILSFLGVENVEFHLKLPDGIINKEFTLALWGQTSYEYVNTWKIFLPRMLLLDIEKKQIIESFILLLKEPQHHYKFYYIL